MRRSMTTNPESELNAGKAYHETSVFIAENLLREARRQRGLGDAPVPDVCVLDPDGHLIEIGEATGILEGI